MAFREKLAWLTLLGSGVAYGVYFLAIGPSVDFGRGNMVAIIGTFGPVAVFHALIMAVGAGALALAAHRDANQKADERDRAIDRRASSVAYLGKMCGIILVGVVGPFSAPAFKIVNASLAVIVICETIRQIVIILGYRRGFHG